MAVRTAKQKAALRKAQLASARKRRKGKTKKKKSTSYRGYKHGKIYHFAGYGSFKYNGKKKQFESTALYRRQR